MMKSKKILIFLDRDGTIIYDKKCYYGSQRNWKSLITLCPGVASGIKQLRKIPNSKIYIATNQPAIAVKELPLLTLKRAKEVTKFVMNKLKQKGAKIDDYEVCEHAPEFYVKSHSQFTFDKKLIGDFNCMKPKPGMLKKIMKREKLSESEVKIYVIGDRISDVKTAFKMNGYGIMIPFSKESKEKAEFKKIKNKNKYLAKNFLDAAKFIIQKENKN